MREQYFKRGVSLKQTTKTLLSEDDRSSTSQEHIKGVNFFFTIYNLLMLSASNIYNDFAFFFV